MTTMNEENIPENAISVYNQGNEAMDDFPILRAFQQYVEREQEKSRRRVTTITIVFLLVIAGICGLFVYLLQISSMRNQVLSDRLVEYAMQEADRRAATPPPVVKDEASIAAITALSTKIEEMQNRMIEKLRETPIAVEAKADTSSADAEAAKAAAEQAEAAAKEIRALKAQLAAERRKAESTPRSPSPEELEAYRRKHYPELYAPKPEPIVEPEPIDEAPLDDRKSSKETRQLPKTIEADDDAINYFDDVEDDAYSIPMEVKGSNTKWLIPVE